MMIAEGYHPRDLVVMQHCLLLCNIVCCYVTLFVVM